MQPYFSFITPMFNRARFISRAIDSCLNQGFEDFEIIVVDDGSTDNSVEVVSRYKDPRVKLFRHEKNQGIGPARNTGVDEARGEWLVILDSDDELLPGALRLIHDETRNLDDKIQRFVFMYQLAYGGESPDPKLTEDIWGYTDYIKWSGTYRLTSDYFNVIKRETFDKVRFPSNRGHELIYHLDFAKYYLTKAVPIVVAIVHSDADNRSLNLSINKLLKDANCFSKQYDEVLVKHGHFIKQISPPLYIRYLQGAITYNMLAGNRLKAIRYAIEHISQRMISLKTLAVLIIGLLGPTTLASMKIRIAKGQKA